MTKVHGEATAEQTMTRSMVIGVAVTLPVTIALFLVMMGIAIGDTQPWYVWVGLGVGIGALAASFLGAIGGVMVSAHLFDPAHD